jgi:hypothetical protein
MTNLMGYLIFRYNNNKIAYYLKNYWRSLIPGFFYRRRLKKKLERIKNYDSDYISDRINYYNKLNDVSTLSDQSTQLSDFRMIKKFKTYFFDSHEYTRYFDPSLRLYFVFGDITKIPNEPAVLKSRPIEGDNSNSILMKLNKIRHFIYIKDRKSFSEKTNRLVFRGTRKQEHRVRFMEMFKNNPMCNVGTFTRDKNDNSLYAGWLSKGKQLDYKFILCLEGYDVSSNLKWVMSSNSIAVMPKPKYETWFMEGRLKPDYHYILIKDDYSDLEERLRYYIENTDEAQKIIRNANEYVRQFKDKNREDLISLLVLEKYFIKTGQKVHSPQFGHRG